MQNFPIGAGLVWHPRFILVSNTPYDLATWDSSGVINRKEEKQFDMS